MDYVYAFGVDVIERLQSSLGEYEGLFMRVNQLADPHCVVNYVFPFLSIFDSVYASEFLLVTAGGEWLNAILKWILMEHRPYWWVRETQYYGPSSLNRPQLKAGPQTCETGPGSPSGHVMAATLELTLIVWWAIAERGKRKQDGCERWLRYLLWSVTSIIISLVATSRLAIATHFPHQCLLGAIFGLLTAYFMSHYFVIPFLFMDENFRKKHPPSDKTKTPRPACSYMRELKWRMLQNILLALSLIVIAFAMYWGLKLSGHDPLWSVKLAFKWCPSPSYLHFNTTPLFSFVISTGTILGWAICVTPSVKSFRIDTKGRSLLLSAMTAILFQQIFNHWQTSISKDNATYFYLMNLAAFTLRPLFFIRIVPFVATCKNRWRSTKVKTKEEERNLDSTNKDK